MKQRNFRTPDEKRAIVGQINLAIKSGSDLGRACREEEISKTQYYHWSDQFGIDRVKPPLTAARDIPKEERPKRTYQRKRPIEINLPEPPVMSMGGGKVLAIFGSLSDIQAFARGLQ